MIRSVEIRGLRGICKGSVEDLPPLAVLVGPNGAGKSSILHALLIAGSPDPGESLREVTQEISKRIPVKGSGRWILWRAAGDGATQVSVSTYSGARQTCDISIDPRGRPRCRPAGEQDPPEVPLGGVLRGRKPGQFEPLSEVPEVKLIDASLAAQEVPLHRLYTEAVEQGRAADAKSILVEAMPEVTNVEILTELDTPVIHLVFRDHSVPAVLAGDGIHMLLRLILELASRPNGVVLLEEPEVHQHPRAIRQSARAILAAVRRDIQIILSTHSLELIDALLDEASDDDLSKMAVYRLALEDGVLKSSRIPGADARFARTQIEDDLR